VNRDTEGWVYDEEIQFQDDWDWNKYEYSTSKKFYLQWKNAFDQFLRLLMGSLAGNEFRELYNADAHDSKSVSLQLEGQGGVYGYLESFPSIYYLIGEKCIPLDMFPEIEVNLGGGQIVNWNKDILKGMQWNSFEEFERLNNDVTSYVVELINYEWDGQLWDIMTEYLPIFMLNTNTKPILKININFKLPNGTVLSGKIRRIEYGRQFKFYELGLCTF
jgi:hypothetical protein